jgi:hypothetical protein
MKKQTHQTGRILRHGKPSSEITEDAIASRARELAIIDGRAPEAVTDEDLARSLAELRGKHLPESTLEDSEVTESLTRDPSDPASNRGTQAPETNELDDQEVTENLVLEGVEEAQHDQMLAARQRSTER